MSFIPNQGQMDERVAYYVQGRDKTTYFTREGLTFAIVDQTNEGKKLPGPAEDSNDAAHHWVVKLDFLGSNAAVVPVGLEETGGVVSYFRGQHEEWNTGLSTYSWIIYRNL